MKPFPCACRPLKTLVFTVVFILAIMLLISAAFMLVGVE